MIQNVSSVNVEIRALRKTVEKIADELAKIRENGIVFNHNYYIKSDVPAGSGGCGNYDL